MPDRLFRKKDNTAGDGADIRTRTITVNLTAARAMITGIITFLCLFMPPHARHARYRLSPPVCRVVAALPVIGCPRQLASWWRGVHMVR